MATIPAMQLNNPNAPTSTAEIVVKLMPNVPSARPVYTARVTTIPTALVPTPNGYGYAG